MIQETLKQLGFSDKETAIYLCILEQGKSSAALIARLTKINRTTVYSVTKELIIKGVIVEDLGSSNRRYFSALPPEDMRDIHEQEEKALKAKKSNIEQAISELASIPQSKQYSVPKIRFIDERHIQDFLSKQLPVWIESAKKYKDHNWWGFQDPSFLEENKEWMEHHWDIFPEDYGVRMFTNKKLAETKLAKQHSSERRQVIYWDKAIDFSATHMVLGDYVLFAMTREHPHYIVEIHDAVMAENLRQLFQGIWKDMHK